MPPAPRVRNRPFSCLMVPAIAGCPCLRKSLPMTSERFHLAGAEVLVGGDVDETVRIAAGQFAALARKIAAEGKPVYAALSGGSTPRLLFQTLAADPFAGIIPWDAIQFFWGDERNVPPGHPESNYSMARELLLSR